MAYLHGVKILSHKIIISYKRMRSDLTVGMPGRHHLNLRDHINNSDYPPRDGMQGERSITSVIFLPRMQNLNLIIRECNKKPHWEAAYNKTHLDSSKVSRSWKSEKDWEMTEKDQHYMKLGVMHGLSLSLFVVREITETAVEAWMGLWRGWSGDVFVLPSWYEWCVVVM